MNAFATIIGGPIAFRLAWGLVHSLWQGALIAAALAAVLPFLRGRPGARYAAGWLALVALAATVPLSAAFAPDDAEPVATAIERPVVVVVPKPPLVAPQPSAAVASPVASPTPAEPAPTPPVAALAPITKPPAPIPADPWRMLRPFAPWIAGGWLLGALLLAFWRLGGWFRLRGLRRSATPASDDLQAVLDRVARRLKVGRAVKLLESARVRAPAVVGWLRPAVLAPLGMLAGMPIEQVELILAHELAHVRRGDFLANLLQTAFETLLFYHPAAWWISRTIRAEREACCDDAVVAATGERLTYGRALAHLAELCAEPLSVPASGGDLLTRVRRIVRPEPIRPLPQAVGGVLALAATLAVTALVAAPQAVKEAVAADPPAGDRPRIVSVSPADGATDVPVETEIRIRFDRPMSPTKTILEWAIGGPAWFWPQGSWRYDEEAREFTLPVRLTPGVKHRLNLNVKQPAGRGDDYEGFRAADGRAAEVFQWSFATVAPRPVPEGAPNPMMGDVRPRNSRGEVGLLTLVTIPFDRPMDPNSYEFSREEGYIGGDAGPRILEASYDAAKFSFSFLMSMPSNWYGELLPQKFRSVEGAPASRYPLVYRTLHKPFDDALSERVAEAARSPKLREVVERTREASRKIESATIHATVTQGMSLAPTKQWLDRIWTYGATFRTAPGGKFTAEVDELMGLRYRVGSDGTTCWADNPREPASAPASAIEDKKMSLIDPFDAHGQATVADLIRDRKLEYVGQSDVNGRRCHEIRSWNLDPRFPDMLPHWFIDAETFLPARVVSSWSIAFDFTYEDINANVPDDVFRVPPGVPPPAPLPEGFTSRYLFARDGTDGYLGVGWGMLGNAKRAGGGISFGAPADRR
ncbi:M56 family metallopeptidase [Paludisphaera rhizosphaerae]|uniref:M56 family metallopeptidase n=1 Tax=Paludisphaera rhizosphaerae TaxID=2711216 RepID=UPI0013EBC39F|nr:M56 family metallopeptidase [Paludisphaera rhizosphaerae]